MMLRPRDDVDQKVLQTRLEIRPQPRELAWERDSLGNHVAIAHFADRSEELTFISTVRVEHTPRGFHEVDVRDDARSYPFSYTTEDWPHLRRFILPLSLQPELSRWCDQFFRNEETGTHALLIDMTESIRKTFRHVARHERGIQDPLRTISLRSGSCRDLAMLMIAALRSRGVAARLSPAICIWPKKKSVKTNIKSRVVTPTRGYKFSFQDLAGSILIRQLALWETGVSHPRRRRGAPLRRNSTTGDMVRERVGSPRNAGRSEGQATLSRNL